jgi:hypothetical protein
MRVALCVAAGLLSACATKPPAQLPTLVEYSREFQRQAAIELLACPAAQNNVAIMLTDYLKLRDAIKAAQE